MKITPNQLTSFSDRTSFYNDNIEQLWIDKVYNKLPKLFEAIILSGMPEQSNSPNVGAVTQADIQEINDNRYYFVRIRPLISAELVFSKPLLRSRSATGKKIN